jgi:hypothetical protein
MVEWWRIKLSLLTQPHALDMASLFSGLLMPVNDSNEKQIVPGN